VTATDVATWAFHNDYTSIAEMESAGGEFCAMSVFVVC